MDSQPTLDSAGRVPVLTAIVVVGEIRERAQEVLDGLYAQTASHSMEVVIADMTGGRQPRLRLRQDLVPTRYLTFSPGDLWGEVRAAAARNATAPLVAFIEDHSLPTSTWAEALIRASPQPWAAAGYTFLNGNPGAGLSWKTYLSWAGFIADYGEWAYPVPPGPTVRIACNNLAYRREDLVALGDDLGMKLHSDINMHEHFSRLGKPIEIVRDAVVAHQNHETISVLFEANHAHCRVIAASRVSQGQWSWSRRIAYALAVPVIVPLMKFRWLMRAQVRRRVLWGTVLSSLPIVLGVYIWASIGESAGYLFGLGNALEVFQQTEVSVRRSAELTAKEP